MLCLHLTMTKVYGHTSMWYHICLDCPINQGCFRLAWQDLMPSANFIKTFTQCSRLRLACDCACFHAGSSPGTQHYADIEDFGQTCWNKECNKGECDRVGLPSRDHVCHSSSGRHVSPSSLESLRSYCWDWDAFQDRMHSANWLAGPSAAQWTYVLSSTALQILP